MGGPGKHFDLLLSSIITCAIYSACNYVLHPIVYFLMPFSVLSCSLLGSKVSVEESHRYHAQVYSRSSAMPPVSHSSYFTELFPTLSVLLTLAEFWICEGRI